MFILQSKDNMVKVELNVWVFVWTFKKWLQKAMPKAVKILEDELKRLTPEDTKEMLSSYVSETKTTDNAIVWEVWNTAEHAIFVEYWVEGQKYNYHKPKWSIFYQWVWNRTFARWVDNTRQKILQTINSELWRL